MPCLERNQVFEVPSTVEDNIVYLTSEVLISFTFGTNVNLKVTSKSMTVTRNALYARGHDTDFLFNGYPDVVC